MVCTHSAAGSIPVISTAVSKTERGNTMEKAKRSLAKAMTFRLLATMLNIAIIYWVFGDLKKALGIGAIEIVLKFGLYYVHERIWSRIKWGRKKKRQ